MKQRLKSSVKDCRTVFLCLLLCIILTPVSVFSAGNGAAPDIRVLLKRLNLTDRADLVLDGAYTVRTGTGADLRLPEGCEVTVQVRDNHLYLFFRGISMSAGDSAVFFRTAAPDGRTGGLRFEKKGPLYPGDLRLTVSGGQLQPVLTVSVEHYLEGVVPYEMSNDFPVEALKAQAVCARTYAIARRSPSRAYDVTDTTSDQVYRGSVSGNTRTEKAIRETAGLIVTSKGAPANCYYSASNGGQTELPSHVWSGKEASTCYAMTDDPYDLENPESIRKKAKLDKKGRNLKPAFLTLLREAVMKKPEMRDFCNDDSCFRVDGITAAALNTPRFSAPSRLMTRLEITVTVSARKPLQPGSTPTPEPYRDEDVEDILLFETATPSPEPTQTPAPTPGETAPAETAPVYTDFLPAGTHTVTLDIFPGVLNALGLGIYGANNEIITVEEEKDCFIIYSGRYGHGVGMSQRGAQWMASHYHKGFEEILNFYYPGMKLMRVSAGDPVLPTADPKLAETPGPPATPTPRPTLMPVTEENLPDGAWIASVENIEDDSSLNLRDDPSQAGTVLMRLYKHQRLIVLGPCEDPVWVHVRTDAAEGYVMASFLEKIQ